MTEHDEAPKARRSRSSKKGDAAMPQNSAADDGPDPLRDLLRDFLRDVQAGKADLAEWDRLCSKVYPGVVPIDCIARFAQEVNRPLPNDAPLLRTPSILLYLAQLFSASKPARSEEAETACDEVECYCRPSDPLGLLPSERRVLEELRNLADEAHGGNRPEQRLDSVTAALRAFDNFGPMNWQEVARAAGYQHETMRKLGPRLLKLGWVRDARDEGHYKKRITKEGLAELRRRGDV